MTVPVRNIRSSKTHPCFIIIPDSPNNKHPRGREKICIFFSKCLPAAQIFEKLTQEGLYWVTKMRQYLKNVKFGCFPVKSFEVFLCMYIITRFACRITHFFNKNNVYKNMTLRLAQKLRIC